MQLGRFKLLPIGCGILLIFLQYRLWVEPSGLRDMMRLKKEVEQHTLENDKLKKRNEQLVSQVKHLRSGPNAMESRARQDLGMIKKGETFYQVIE